MILVKAVAVSIPRFSVERNPCELRRNTGRAIISHDIPSTRGTVEKHFVASMSSGSEGVRGVYLCACESTYRGRVRHVVWPPRIAPVNSAKSRTPPGRPHLPPRILSAKIYFLPLPSFFLLACSPSSGRPRISRGTRRKPASTDTYPA